MASLPDGTLFSISKYKVITFYNDAGEIVGEIDYSGKNIIFDGKTDESANSLFRLIEQAIGPFKW